MNVAKSLERNADVFASTIGSVVQFSGLNRKRRVCPRWPLKRVKERTVFRGSMDRKMESKRIMRHQGADSSERPSLLLSLKVQGEKMWLPEPSKSCEVGEGPSDSLTISR